MLTMLLYSVGTALCAFAPNVWLLALFRLIASLGIGGEWAAGASMVAEVVPEKRRIEAGALLYTSAPFGLALATLVNYVIAGQLFAGQPEVSWRYVFLSGLIPAAVALAVRYFVKEPERWAATARNMRPPTVGELFTPAIRPLTISGLITALTALVAWWSCNAFIPIIGSGLAEAEAQRSRAGHRCPSGPQRELEGADHQLVQPRRLDRDAADRTGSETDGPSPDVRALLPRRGGCRC